MHLLYTISLSQYIILLYFLATVVHYYFIVHADSPNQQDMNIEHIILSFSFTGICYIFLQKWLDLFKSLV